MPLSFPALMPRDVEWRDQDWDVIRQDETEMLDLQDWDETKTFKNTSGDLSRDRDYIPG